MSDDMNLDASSAHENCETGQISPPRQETSILKHEFVSRSLDSKAIGEKPMISTENVNKGSIEARAGECNYDGIEQLGPLQEDLTRNSSREQLGRQPECATQSSNSEQFGCLSVQAAGEKLSAKQATSDINHELVLESVNSEALVEKEKVGIDHIKDGPDETGTVEIDHLGLEPPENERKSSPEQLGVPPEDSAINTSLEELKPIPADVSQNSDLKQFETGTVEIDLCGHQSSGLPSEDIAKNSTWEKLKPAPEDERKPSPEQLGVPPEDVGENPSLEQLKPLPDNVSKNCDLKHIGSGTVESDRNGLGIYGLPSKDKSQNSFCKQLMPPPEDGINSSPGQLGVPPEDVAVNPSPEQLKPLPDNLSKNCVEQFELPPAGPASDPSKSGSRGRRTSAKSTKGKHGPRYSLGNNRLLRSRSQEKPKAPKPSNNFSGRGDDADSEKSKKRKKKQIRKTPVDEFSRIRKHLRYLLHRITYEQNLIDAYSGEGWKGQSLEKLKPEKELQRAKSEIFRCKLKIRDLFQRLDLSIAEGRLPASLFDSEGQIDSEDIFCAKCGSMDLPADNDIILCDGACERGFHQFCLEPPLLKEDIPPDDEGWLCPGCDCKVDCIDLINDSQGTKLSVLDTWERVFPEEAAAAAAGNKLDDYLGLPSDNSEDSDYNPDGSEGDEKVDGDESSSDESDFYSASEDIGSSPKSKQKLEISSDDSEDDEYDPNAPELDEQVKEESSSSDFTSDSEDFSVALDDHRSPYENESVLDKPMSASFNHTKPRRGSDGESSKVDQRKKRSINDELLSLLHSGPGEGKSAPVSVRRHVERLDYKKLYDDAYPNDSSDSSDENWMDAANAPKKRRKHNIEESDAEDMNHDREENEHTPKQRVRKKLGTNNSTPRVYKASSEHGSSGTGAKKSTYRRLGEAATQGLLKSFRQNQYPERGKKENLAKELGITLHQVSKWFENARWSFRHSPHMKALVEAVPSNSTPPRMNPSEPAGNSLTEESSRQRSKTPKSRKKSHISENQESDHNLSTEETQNPSPPVDLPKAEKQRKRGRPPKAQEGRRRGRPKSRKSAA